MAHRNQAVAADYFQRYISLAKDEDVIKALRKSTKKFRQLLDQIPGRKVNHAYAEGKWTVKQILQHVIDAERVFTYRALTFSRKDGTPLPGFDEEQWATNAPTGHRKWKDLVAEFRAVRNATEKLFESFTEDQLLATGVAGNHPANALGFGYICAGHALHHMGIIKDRYL